MSLAVRDAVKRVLPDAEECRRLMAEMGMLHNIRRHSLQVCRVALYLTDGLSFSGIRLDRDLVAVAALLHDITKTRSLRTQENHARSGGDLLTQMGYPDVGAIIAQHVRLQGYDPIGGLREEEIVNYADKRVLNDRIVSLPDRMHYILERYGATPDRQGCIRDVWLLTEELERKIFRELSVDPDDLADSLPAADHLAGIDQDDLVARG